ncbi:MAG: hypothetical protein DRQ55_02135 [Planctomycetota bacterium]|nr:MAG: hypothetical protein DRQ55_02135 [Planctomycetota bacterium]
MIARLIDRCSVRTVPGLLTLLAALSLAPVAHAQDESLAFLEAFAFSGQREVALDQLVPGSPEWYRYRCLALQHMGRLHDADAVLEQWIARHGHGADVELMQNRQALLRYDLDPARTFAYLRARLEPRLDHRRQLPGEQPELPPRLDPSEVDWPAFLTRAEQRPGGLSRNLDPEGLARLLGNDLDDDQLMLVLNALRRADYPGLPELVVRNLTRRGSQSFGSLRVHAELTLAQLQECARLLPALLDQGGFVQAWVARLAAPDHADWRHDVAARGQWLERLLAFTRGLSTNFSSLKAQVLHQQLVHDHALGVHDRELFLEYLSLPRQGALRSDAFTNQHRGRLVQPDQDHGTGLPPIGDDQALLRAYLDVLLRDADGWDAYAAYLDSDALRRIFAETKLLHGVGDGERWYALLDDPEALAALKDRVEIRFAAGSRARFAPDDSVSLEVDLKNVGSLLVRVFELDTFTAYADRGREIDIDVVLDGLLPNDEQLHPIDAPPLRRVRRRFEFPELTGAGVWVLEFVGNGVASRALIHKGRLSLLTRISAAGHVLRVLDDDGQHLPDARVWFGRDEFLPDSQGEVLIPFSHDSPGLKPLVLRHGERASLAQLDHVEESYSLRAAVFVERESLLPRATARVVVRPQLLLDNVVVSLSLLDDVLLVVEATDFEGTTTRQELRDLELDDGTDLVHEISVPERLSLLTVQLTGRVTNLAWDEQQDVAATEVRFPIAAIVPTTAVEAALLGRTSEGYVLDVLGRSGEALAGHALQLSFQHALASEPHSIWLRTDDHGRVVLGELPEIESLRLHDVVTGHDTWNLMPDRVQWPERVHLAHEELLRLPWPVDELRLQRAHVSLLELRGAHVLADHFERLELSHGLLVARDLPVGSYRMLLRPPGLWHELTLEVLPGTRRGGWIVGSERALPAQGTGRLQITQLSTDSDVLTLRLENATESTRVHVTSSRWLPAFDPFELLRAQGSLVPLGVDLPRGESLYAPSRALSDEERYVLERRQAQAFPGNMLDRPTLLLNPWALATSTTDFNALGANSVIGVGVGGGGSRLSGRGMASGRPQGPNSAGGFPDLSFLPEPARTLTNLRPDADGVLRVPLADLGPGHLVQVLAIDGQQTLQRSLSLPEHALEPEDLRLAVPFSEGRTVTEQRRIDVLAPGERAVFEDVSTSAVEVIDTLAGAFSLLSALGDSDGLAPFEPLTRWPQLSREEQLAFYDEHACHELHLFLHHKDPAFFDEVVRPYLTNKRALSFVDRWLLEQDLSAFAEPWAFGQLNVAERILLAQRLPELASTVERELSDSLALRAPDPAAERRRFETALHGGALQGGSAVAAALELGRGLLTGRGKKPTSSHGGHSRAPGDSAPSGGTVPPPTNPAGAAAPGPRVDEVLESTVAADAARRALVRRQLWSGPGDTRLYVEHDYWHRRQHEMDATLVRPNGFWLELAATRGARPFVSARLGEATSHVNEMLLALALLDLPFEAAEHLTTLDDQRFSLEAGGPLLLVRREITDAPRAQAAPPVLVSQGVFRLDDRRRWVNGRYVDRFVTDEYVAGAVYGCQVVVTNPTSAQLELELLLQVPEGAVPVYGGLPTRGLDLSLAAYATQRHELLFYFPRAGSFRHYPAQVALDGEHLTAGEFATRRVVDQPSVTDTDSWEFISQQADAATLWAFLDDANLATLDLERMAWRMGERAFFDQAVAWMRRRQVQAPTLWAYALQHEDADAARAYLQGQLGFVSRCGPSLRSPLLAIDEHERRLYEHVELMPHVNQRVHAVRGRHELLNSELAGQWRALLELLVSRPQLSDADWMAVTYYLLLQGRTAEAVEAYARVSPASVTTPMTYDALGAWLAMSRGAPAEARALAEIWADHPVPRWRARFAQILEHVAEATGHAAQTSEGDDGARVDEYERPWLELELSDGRIELRHEQLTSVELRYTPMDVELLFSTRPFVERSDDGSSLVRPARVDQLPLDPDGSTRVELPARFANSNVLIEARARGLVRRQAHYAHNLSVALFASQGELRVTRASTGELLPAAYVKVYARDGNGRARFHKDGYTDLRGRFDYASITASDVPDPERFALLVMSTSDGAVIREVDPPAR